MEEKDYSAGLTHEIFWLQESRKTAELMMKSVSLMEYVSDPVQLISLQM